MDRSAVGPTDRWRDNVLLRESRATDLEMPIECAKQAKLAGNERNLAEPDCDCPARWPRILHGEDAREWRPVGRDQEQAEAEYEGRQNPS